MRKNRHAIARLVLSSAAGIFLLVPANMRAQGDEAGAQDNAAATGASFGQITVKHTSVAEVDSSHVRISVDMVTTPSRNVTVESVRLTGLKLNGMPVYAEAMHQPLDLVKGEETALPPIYVTARMRDLTTTAPLRQMIENQSVHVDAQVIASIKMSFLQKLALHSEHPRVSFPISQDVAVSVGSSPFERQAALGILSLVEVGLHGRAVAGDIRNMESPWVRELRSEARTNLFHVESSYKLRQRGTDFPVINDQLGFRLTTGQIITTAEAREPWAYDAEFLGKIKSGDVKLDKKSLEMQLISPGAQGSGATLQMTRGDFSVDERGDADKEDLIIKKVPKDSKDADKDDKDQFAKVTVRRRASPNAISVITLRTPLTQGGFHAAPATVVQQDSWDKVALYRLMIDSQNKASIEVIEISARRDGQGIHLDEPVDPSFYGSPIIVPEGVLGIVQDEQSGAFLPADIANAASEVPVRSQSGAGK
ncbi:hypothetical protein ACFPT7_23140 [Acidicapsa dinghuensis]|uniref:DUF748 domain-containing protein n=1 Tax=Acidicapsa dinghuensis TaxID=2218256 RepID=A0ABW1ELS9_9BACT|nr:hypothetical protein [Acidicapsa dinghuensis]